MGRDGHEEDEPCLCEVGHHPFPPHTTRNPPPRPLRGGVSVDDRKVDPVPEEEIGRHFQLRELQPSQHLPLRGHPSAPTPHSWSVSWGRCTRRRRGASRALSSRTRRDGCDLFSVGAPSVDDGGGRHDRRRSCPGRRHVYVPADHRGWGGVDVPSSVSTGVRSWGGTPSALWCVTGRATTSLNRESPFQPTPTLWSVAVVTSDTRDCLGRDPVSHYHGP